MGAGLLVGPAAGGILPRMVALDVAPSVVAQFGGDGSVDDVEVLPGTREPAGTTPTSDGSSPRILSPQWISTGT